MIVAGFRSRHIRRTRLHYFRFKNAIRVYYIQILVDFFLSFPKSPSKIPY